MMQLANSKGVEDLFIKIIQALDSGRLQIVVFPTLNALRLLKL